MIMQLDLLLIKCFANWATVVLQSRLHGGRQQLWTNSVNDA